MKAIAIHIILFCCFMQLTYSQTEDGVVALDIPARNSLMFNRFLIHPTFSFVREQNKYITATGKRELIEIEDAPNTYFFNYSGRLKENIGAGIGFYQQTYGVLTSFGGIANFAYNVRIGEDSNLTFGTNVGAYQSSLNTGRVVTNFDDPALNNVPSNFLLTINPGINYGTGFMDFGLSFNNAVTYNFNASSLMEENPKQGIQGHMMYTGYFGGYGFFGESKFTALGKSEFRKDDTILSGIMMLTVPKGIWAQVGYNSMYGASGGVGINISPQIAIEYNYEKPLVGLTNLGSAHEITLAYRFKNNNYFDFSNDDEAVGLFTSGKKKKKKRTSTPKAVVKAEPEPQVEPTPAPVVEEPAIVDTEEQARLAAEEKARLDAQEQARLAAEEQARLEAQEQARLDSEERARLAAEEQARLDTQEQARLAAEEQARLDAEQQARLAAEEQARLDAEEQARLAAEEQARLDAEEQARLAAEEQARLDAQEQARLAAEEQARLDAQEQARLAAEEQARLDAQEQARLAAEEQARLDAQEQARLAAEEQARLDAQEQARLAAEEQARLDAENNSNENLIKNPTDNIGQTISEIANQTEEVRAAQTDLLGRLEAAVAIKKSDLKDLKEENDLSERNIYVAPKPFKSISEENNRIELLKIDLDTVILRQKKKIAQLESLLQDRIETINNPSDETNLYYQSTLTKLKTEQEKAIRTRESLVSSLKQIAIDTDIERKRRIKRAVYKNDQDRYSQDRFTMQSLRKGVTVSETAYSKDDFDFGKERGNNIQIIKNVQNTEEGYYLVIALHSDVSKRDEFLTKVISSGYRDVDFFFDVNTSEYYIYTKKYNTIREAQNAMGSQPNTPYNGKTTIIKIEN